MTVTLEKFSELVAGIYGAALDGTRWEATLQDVVDAFGGTGGALLVASPRTRRFRHASVGADHAAITAYNDYYGRMDPVAAAIERVPAGAVTYGHEVFAGGLQRRRCEFYEDWATTMIDGGDGIYANLARSGDSLGWLSIAAPMRSQSFGSEPRMRLMRLLVPHLQHALSVQSHIAEIELQRRRALDALERVAHGVAMLDAGGGVLFANSAALSISASSDGPKIGRAGIRASQLSEDAVLQRSIANASGRTRRGPRGGETLTLARGGERQPLVVHVLPAVLDDPDVADGTLVLIVDPEREMPSLAAALKRLYGLTRKEARVATEILRGDGLQAVADRMSVTLSTVRVHLQNVFDKTQTHRQTELMRLLLSIEAGMGLDDGSAPAGQRTPHPG
jgi:DNA-binding CsgD family transcriptional regulator